MFRVLILSLFLLLPSAVLAQATICTTPAAPVIASIQANGFGEVRLSEKDAAGFLTSYNLIPPPTDLKPAEMVFFVNPSVNLVVVLFMDNAKCLIGADQIPLPMFNQLINAGQGT